MKPGLTGIRRWGAALQNSLRGFKDAFRGEAAFREEVKLLIASIIIAYFFTESFIEAALIVGSVLLLMIVELLNSAVEAVVDRIGEEYHELSRQAKDMASAAVLLAIFILVSTWLIILLPQFIH